MPEDPIEKKVIKKKIKLKVSSSGTEKQPEPQEAPAKIEEVAAAPVAAPVTVAAAPKPKAVEPEIKKEKPQKEEVLPRPSDDHLKRMNAKFSKMMKPDVRPEPQPMSGGNTAPGVGGRKFEYQRFNSNNRGPGPGGPGAPGSGGPGGPNRPGGFQRDGGARRTFVPRDKSGPGGESRGRFGGPKPAETNTTIEKDHGGKGKHRNTFQERSKGVSFQEKNKNREEEILLSKMEDNIRKKNRKGEAAIPEEIEINETVKISDLAKRMNLKASEIIQRLIDLGVQATINDTIDSDTAAIVASEFNCKVKVKSLKEEIEIKEDADNPEDQITRFPVVTIMGHVDHGKTSLLDSIRNSSVAAHETGGITQHIGAYRVKTNKGEISFVDTPGHEAFTAMRARGANVTDIVILVVSAVEGPMPQTIEALNHAKAAKVPIIVAINKIDLPDSNPEKVKQQLAEQNLLPEEWGGDTMYLSVSAAKKIGIQELLDAILLQAEVLELKADPKKKGVGFVVESKMDIGRGAVATVIVKNGCVKVGDHLSVGTTMGKVRGMFDENGNKMQIALPSYPVEIMGFDEVPNAGDKFFIVESEEVAKNITEKRQNMKRADDNKNIKKFQMQNALEAMTTGSLKELKVIIKGDVQGSVEAIRSSLEKLVNTEVKVTVISSGVGAVLESDVMLASATANTAETGAIILAFRVRVDTIAKEKAESEGITIKRYNIIYELIDFIDNLMKGMLTPEIIEHVIGSAEIRDVFKIKDSGKIAGSYVTTGFIRKAEKVRIFRDSVQVWEGKISALKRFKEDVAEVQEGFECGISLLNYENFKKGDTIECFSSEVKKVI